MPTYTTPGLYVETVDPEPEPVLPARVDIAGFAGVTARGPLHTPVRITSEAQFRARFGGPIRNGLLAYAVKAFLDNGGQVCHVVRVAAPELPLQLSGVQPADRRSSVLADVRGLAEGSVVTFRQGEIVHHYLAQAISVGTNTVTWDRVLDPDLILSNPIELAGGSGTASATVNDDAGGPGCLRLRAASPGRWGNAVRVRVSRTSGAATATDLTRPQPPGRDASYVDAVAGFDPGTLVRVDQTGQPSVRRLVTAADPVTRRLTWDTPLPAGLSLTATIRFEVESFGLAVLEGGTTREVFARLSLTPSHPRYVPAVLAAGSAEIRAEVLGAGVYRLPAPAGVVLQGGRDGTAALTVTDLLGDPSDSEAHGLRALETVVEVALVAVPDLVAEPTEALVLAPPPAPPYDPCLEEPPISLPVPRDPELVERSAAFGIEQVYLGQLRMVDSCERLADRIALLDPPRLRTGDTPLHVDALREWRARFDSSYAALHAPWVQVIDPVRTTGPDVLRPLPPSGHVAGVIARVDADRGPAQAPANEELFWAYALDGDIDAATHGLLNPEGISVLRRFEGRGLRVYGARTVSSTPLLELLNVRRLLISIRRALNSAMQWVVFEPANLATRQLLTTSIRSYLMALYEQGAFSGATPEEAFFVRCDEELNPPGQAALGLLVAEIGVAPVRPAEFVVLRIGRTENGLDFAGAQSRAPELMGVG